MVISQANPQFLDIEEGLPACFSVIYQGNYFIFFQKNKSELSGHML